MAEEANGEASEETKEANVVAADKVSGGEAEEVTEGAADAGEWLGGQRTERRGSRGGVVRGSQQGGGQDGCESEGQREEVTEWSANVANI